MPETITEELVDRIKHRLDNDGFDVNQMYQTDIRINMYFEEFEDSLIIKQVYIKKCSLLLWLCTRDDDKYSDVLDKILNNKRCDLDTQFVWSYTDNSPDADKVPYTDDLLVSDAGTSDYISSVRAAVSMGNYDVTKKLLQTGAHTEGLRKLDKSGHVWLPSLLEIAIEMNRADIVKLLLEYNSEMFDAPLHMACDRGYVEIAKMLLDVGCDMTDDDLGQSTLQLAHRKGHKDVQLLLIKRGACILPKHVYTYNKISGFLDSEVVSAACDPDSEWFSDAAIRVAAIAGRIDLVKSLLNRDCDVNVADSLGHTALHYASRLGYDDTVRLLIEHGCAINATNKTEETALHLASRYGRYKVVRSLVEGGCDAAVRVGDKGAYFKKNSLHLAADNLHSDIVKYLLHHNESLVYSRKLRSLVEHVHDLASASDFRYENNLDALLCRIIVCDTESSQLADVFASIIELAPYATCKSIINSYRKLNVNSRFSDGETALHCALRLDSYRKCKLLLHKGADCSIKWNGQNALEYAVANNCSSKIVNVLVPHYATADLPGMLFANSFVNESNESCLKRLGVGVNKPGFASEILLEAKKQILFKDGLDFSISTKFMEVMENQTKTVLSNRKYENSCTTEVASIFAFPQMCEETREIKRCTEAFLGCFAKYYSNHPQHKNSLVIHLAGSMAEGTKVYLPNEFDAVCEITRRISTTNELTFNEIN